MFLNRISNYLINNDYNINISSNQIYLNNYQKINYISDKLIIIEYQKFKLEINGQNFKIIKIEEKELLLHGEINKLVKTI